MRFMADRKIGIEFSFYKKKHTRTHKWNGVWSEWRGTNRTKIFAINSGQGRQAGTMCGRVENYHSFANEIERDGKSIHDVLRQYRKYTMCTESIVAFALIESVDAKNRRHENRRICQWAIRLHYNTADRSCLSRRAFDKQNQNPQKNEEEEEERRARSISVCIIQCSIVCLLWCAWWWWRRWRRTLSFTQKNLHEVAEQMICFFMFAFVWRICQLVRWYKCIRNWCWSYVGGVE